MKKKDEKSLIWDKLYIVLFVVALIAAVFLFETKKEYVPFTSFYVSASDHRVGISNFDHIKPYQDEEGNYFLFLPSHFNEKTLILGLNGTSYVYIDDKKVEDNGLFSLSEGEHVLKTIEGDEILFTCFHSANVGMVSINTETGYMEEINADKNHSETGSVAILNKDGYIQYAGKLSEIRGRGNAAWVARKQGYQITLDKASSLFGMESAKKWVLLANYYDHSILRNYFVYDLAQEIDMEYSPQFEYVDLYLNGEYWGNYLLCEKIEVGKNRVNIEDLEKETENLNENALDSYPLVGDTSEEVVAIPDTKKYFQIPNNASDITGGYLLELELDERYTIEEPSGFVSTRKQAVVCSSPKYASEEQIDYISKLYQELEDAAFSEDGKNEETGKYYYEYLDMKSFAQKYLVEEITKNLDGSISSFYVYKHADHISSLLYAGPVWDYDRAVGVDWIYEEEIDLSDPNGLWTAHNMTGSSVLSALAKQDEFHKLVLEQYDTVFRDNVLEAVDNKIPQKEKEIEQSRIMDSVRWKFYDTYDREEIINAYREDVEWVTEFLNQRIMFLDEEWGF